MEITLTWLADALMVCTVTFAISTAVLPVRTWTSGHFTEGASPSSELITLALIIGTNAVSCALYIASATRETRITDAVPTVHGHLGSICARIFARWTHPARYTVGTRRRIGAFVAETYSNKAENVNAKPTELDVSAVC